MLTFCVVLIIGLSGLRAQSNSEYKFRQQSVTDGVAYNANGDPVPVLSMDCLAANAYGQWTLSTKPGQSLDGTTGANEFPFGWYLLANGLYQPSIGYEFSDATNHPYCVPPGVVQCGPLPGLEPFPTAPDAKAVANLDGMVAFIWRNSDGSAFVQSGFTSADVDLSLSFLSNPEPGSTPGAGTMNILPDPSPGTPPAPHNWGNISVGPNTITNSPGDWRGNFDVCADAMYIYIVWGYIPPTTPPTPPAPEQIWVAIVPIGSSIPWAIGRISFSADSWKIPTITCDPRNNRNGGTIPAFDVSFIDATSNQIWAGSYSAQHGWTNFGFLSQSYWDPNSHTPSSESWEVPFNARIIRSSINGGTSSLAVYAEVANTGFTQAAGGAADCWLIFYPPTNIFGTANYVAGAEMQAPKLEGQIVPMSSPNPPVYANYITAFADPYDNQAGWQSLDEFHCLYQYDLHATGQYPLCIVRGSDVDADWPPQPDGLTDDTRLVLNQTGGAMSTIEDNPSGDEGTINPEYVAAVNQMGIHVHWRSQDPISEVWTHYYARDMNRTFDEPIEENTLMTDQCTVSDGTATGTNHGGTNGATILNGLEMTIWTDPNYGPPGDVGLSHFGLYSPLNIESLSPYIGTLTFASGINSDNLALNVGLSNLWSPEFVEGAILAVMPYFSMNFLPDVDNDLSQALIVNANSIFDYYGRIAAPNANGNYQFASPFQGFASIQLIGTEQSGVPNYAKLNVHAGADFYESTISHLISNDGAICMLYGPSIFPTTNGTWNSDATGHMTLRGGTYLSNGQVIGNIPHIPNDMYGNVLSRQVIMTFDRELTDYDQFIWGPEDFSATGVWFRNLEIGGTSELLFGHGGNTGNTQPFIQCGLQNCDFNGIELHVFDPTDPIFPENWMFWVTYCNFWDIRNKCILIENDQSPIQTSYGQMAIENNIFNSLYPGPYGNDNAYSDLGPSGVSEELPCGIYLRGLDGNGDASNNGYLVPIISGNYFTYPNGFQPTVNANANSDWNSVHQTNGAITLENSTAMVTGNTIADNGYPVGISIINPPVSGFSKPPWTYSIICNNTISGLTPPSSIPGTETEAGFDGTGILANGLHGIISQNTITGNDNGIEMYDDNLTGVLYNAITANTEIGIETNSGPNNPSFADMSSTALGYDPKNPGAFNTVSGEAVRNSESEQTYPLSLTEYGNITIQDGKNSFTVNPTNSDGVNTHNFVIYSNQVSANIGNVENNFWGTGVAPTTNCGTDWGSNISVQRICFTIGSGPCTQYQTQIPNGETCPTSAPVAKAKKHSDLQPQSILSDSASCAVRWAEVYSYEEKQQWQEIYDTGKLLVDSCYNNYQGMEGIFGFLSGAVQQLYIADTNIYSEYNQWLESVLYLNTTDPQYFCDCAVQLSGTLTSNPNKDTTETLNWKALNRGLAVLNWLVQNTTCDTPQIAGEIKSARSTQRQEWLNDTSVPLDTTLPPLDSIQPGLLELLDRHLLYADVPFNFHGILSNATANPNPATEGTVISFSIAKEAYVKIELFNVLGHEVGSAGFESLFEPGNKSVPLSLAGLPSGTYFARILTAYGEVQSVKLVKE